MPSHIPSKRLFFGIEIPQHIKQEIFSLCKLLPPGRRSHPDNWHITLNFLGHIPLATYDSLLQELSQFSENEFELRIQGIGCFPSLKRARVLWLGIEDGGKLQNIKTQIDSLLTKLNIDIEKKAFRPHLTLLRNPRASHQELQIFLDTQHDFQSSIFQVDTVILYSSTPQSNASHYKKEFIIPLDIK